MEEANTKFDMGYQPVRIFDAASMLRKLVDPNERPYNKTVIKSNNRIVDEWFEQVLKKICGQSGTILAGQMWCEWQYFYAGKTIKKFMDGLENGSVCRPSEKSIEYWVKVFTESNVKQLIDLGSQLIGHGWKLIVDESFIRSQLAKWEKIYSQSDDPLVWRKLANDNPKLWNVNGDSPFWGPDDFVKICEKVSPILKISISPSQ